jgi:4-hydroxy-3-polyprenylbenzoate decarboxylase
VSKNKFSNVPLSRRDLIGTGLSLAALGVGHANAATGNDSGSSRAAPRAPFNSLRDYIAALDARGLVVRIPRADQDAYEATALWYRYRDQHGMNGAPTLVFDELRIDGKWIRGPLIVNECGHPYAECLAFGLEPVDEGPFVKEPFASYRKARDYLEQIVAENDGRYPKIAPVEVPSDEAPCREIIRTGDDIDLTVFPFIQCNPGDVGRYINTGMVFTRHPKYGTNFGTYRCHLRGPREIGVNTEPGQTGYTHLMAARQRGEKIARVSIVLSPDPYLWMVSGNRLVNRREGPVDEIAVAGGLAGRPVEVVQSLTNEHLVPAHAEMIIEGEIPLDDRRPEGPYGEMAGYQGAYKDEQFWMRVTAISHRRDPWIMNNFTGAQRGTLMAAGHALSLYALKKEIPAVVDYFSDNRAVGVTFASIRKTRPGQGLEIARRIAEKNYFAKIVVVVDEDLDVTNQQQMLAALGTRWQPINATHLYESMNGLPLDPSAVRRGRTSKVAIDATRQWPEEGGPKVFPSLNRALLDSGAPDAFAEVDERWGELIRGWRVS